MKIYNDNNQIVSLENICSISKVTNCILRAIYNDDTEAMIRLDSAEEADKAMKKITSILQKEKEEENIIFNNLRFRKADLVYVRLSNYHIEFVFGGRGGQLVETSIGYSSEKTAKANYQMLLEILK